MKYIGQKFGSFIVLEKINTTHYLCECQDCGKQQIYTQTTIKKENTGKCTCSRGQVKIGQKYTHLTVIKRDFEKKDTDRHIFWICKCDCGKIISVSGKHLVSGHTKSCGCLVKQQSAITIQEYNENHLLDLVGKIYGKLQVIRLASEFETINKPKGKRYWYCKCECGNFHIASTSDLQKGGVKSCGCLNSLGEAIIQQLLTKNNIPYISQYKFNDLKGKNNTRYSFDFAIIDESQKIQYLIEFDGIQHYDKKRQFSNSEETLLEIQYRDNIKNMYCKANNIPLIRIPYYHLSKLTIEDLKLNTSNFIIK